jgi:hypothetical protein
LSALVDENELPLADSAMDRVMLVHALETTNAAARGVAVLASEVACLRLCQIGEAFGREWIQRPSGTVGLIREPDQSAFA